MALNDKTLLKFPKFLVNGNFVKEEIETIEHGDNSVYIFETFEDFECAGDEVLVESTPPDSPEMAARLAQPAQGLCEVQNGGVNGGGASPPPSGSVRELIVIPEIPSSIHLQHAIHQVSSSVVEVNGDSSGHSSPTAEAQHTYITVASKGACHDHFYEVPVKAELHSDPESEGGNYHVQYVEPQEIYNQGSQAHMESLNSYPVYGVATVGNAGSDAGWTAECAAYGVVVAGEEAEAGEAAEGAEGAEAATSPARPAAPPARMPPATVQWLLDHYETAEGVSLPRSTLYAHYLRHCAAHRLDPVNAASFGKLIRSVFIGLRTRRLGTRGNSKYHYYGIRAKQYQCESPPRVDSIDDKADTADQQESREREADQSPIGVSTLAHRQYLGSVSAPEPPPLTLDELPPDIPPSALLELWRHHREHGVEFLEAVAALDTGRVERARRAFWRRPPPALCRKLMLKLTAKKEVAEWLRKAELELYQKAVELLLPDVLRPIPGQLTQAIRNFAKSLESALAAGAGGAPTIAAKAQASAAAALAAALRRYTSLNHLAQAARAVLNNHHQIQQMLADLNRVDFRVVREQAAWACSCTNADTAHRLEADFKATLGRGATLEQWARWLECCVQTALENNNGNNNNTRPDRDRDYTCRARRLLLHWSFYSSLVIRELTLRSAASFGSFHLIRLLYDEYVSYLVERCVAQHCGEPPIAVMHNAQETELEESVCDDNKGDEDADPDDPDWEWDDDEEDDEDTVECKKPKMQGE